MSGTDQYSNHINPDNLTQSQETARDIERAKDEMAELDFEKYVELCGEAGCISVVEIEFYTATLAED